MFDFNWSEIALVGAVALVLIGPKDMPVAIKAIAGAVKKARRMAGEFQGHFEEMMREADLSEMRGTLHELRSLDLRGTVARAIDPDGSLRGKMAQKVFTPDAPDNVMRPLDESAIADQPDHAMPDPSPYQAPPRFEDPRFYAPASTVLRPDFAEAPAFIPPDAVSAERAIQGAPAFIPPEAVAHGAAGVSKAHHAAG